MIRKLISGLVLSALLFTGLLQTSCMGKFALLRKVYTWNEKATGNKFINNLLFWILNIIPVYGFVTFVDVVIFNLIEFWTGSNPMAMSEGVRIEKRMNDSQGHEFLAVASKNRMEVLFDHQPEKNFALVYQPGPKSWMLETNSKTICVAKELDVTHIAIYQPDGNLLRVNKDFDARTLACLVMGKMVTAR